MSRFCGCASIALTLGQSRVSTHVLLTSQHTGAHRCQTFQDLSSTLSRWWNLGTVGTEGWRLAFVAWAFAFEVAKSLLVSTHQSQSRIRFSRNLPKLMWAVPACCTHMYSRSKGCKFSLRRDADQCKGADSVSWAADGGVRRVRRCRAKMHSETNIDRGYMTC